jgi:hypothetical protein
MTKLRVVVLLAVVALLLFPAMAVAQDTPPQPPCRFYGEVMVDGAAVPDGTVIKAIVDGDEYTVTTPAAGYGASSYAVKIEEPDGSDYSGATVTFMIGGQTAAETSTWVMGANVNVDLTSGDAPIPTDGGISSVQVEMIGVDQPASATLSDGVLTLKIPAGQGQDGAKGDKGDKGDTGATGAQGPEGPAGSGGIALPVVALVIAIIAAGIAVMGMRRRV